MHTPVFLERAGTEALLGASGGHLTQRHNIKYWMTEHGLLKYLALKGFGQMPSLSRNAGMNFKKSWKNGWF
jgi:hypothetical protein